MENKQFNSIIKKIRKPIDKVVDRVIDRVAKTANKLMAKAKKGGKKIAGAAKNLVAKLKAFIFPRKKFKAGKELEKKVK